MTGIAPRTRAGLLLPALLLTMLLVAGGPALADEHGELVDVSGLLREMRDRRAPRLGIEGLRSGGLGFGFDDYEDEEHDRVTVGDLARLVDDGVGREGAAEPVGGTLLRLDARMAPFARQCLWSLAADLSRTVRIEVAAIHPDARVSRGEIQVHPGLWGSMSQVRSHSIICDFDVELACDNSGGFNPCVVGDPIVQAALDGFAAEARAFLVDGGRAVALEAHLQLERLVGLETWNPGARYLGAIELPTSRAATVLVSGTVAPGEALVTRIRTSDGETVISIVARVGGASGTDRLRLLDVGLATLGAARMRLPTEGEGRVGLQWEAEAATEELWPAAPLDAAEALASESFPGAEGAIGDLRPFGPGRLVAAGPLEFIEEAREKLAKRLEPLARSVSLEFSLRAGEEVVGQATLNALDGRMAFLRVGTDRNLVRDHDVEVGCYVQIADPIVYPVFSGWLLQATPRIAPDGETVMLALASRIQGMGAAPRRRELGEVVCGSLQLITMPSREVDADLVLTLGALESLSLGSMPDGRPLVLTVRCVKQASDPVSFHPRR